MNNPKNTKNLNETSQIKIKPNNPNISKKT